MCDTVSLPPPCPDAPGILNLSRRITLLFSSGRLRAADYFAALGLIIEAMAVPLRANDAPQDLTADLIAASWPSDDPPTAGQLVGCMLALVVGLCSLTCASRQGRRDASAAAAENRRRRRTEEFKSKLHWLSTARAKHMRHASAKGAKGSGGNRATLLSAPCAICHEPLLPPPANEVRSSTLFAQGTSAPCLPRLPSAFASVHRCSSSPSLP